MNILLVTLDQLRADMVGHPLVETPTLDLLCQEGTHFARHFSQAAPCSPGRASLYTGTYQMNHRVVANGTPLDRSFDNVARLARRAGMTPWLFGYTDQGLDPRDAEGDDDPRLEFYSGILPGFEIGLWMPEEQTPWLDQLEELGYGSFPSYLEALAAEPDRPEDVSNSAFLSDAFIAWMGGQEPGWFAHLSYLRPHPPYAAAGRFASMYDPADCGLGLEPAEEVHDLHEIALSLEASAAPTDEAERRRMRAQYFGMVSEVDFQLGRALDAIRAEGQWDDTLVIVTADHGEQLGDHGLKEKLGFFPQSYAIPLIVRDPTRPDSFGRRVERITENVDVMATIAVALGEEVPAQVDGTALQPLLDDVAAPWSRRHAHWEWDWRAMLLGGTVPASLDRRLSEQNLAVIHDEDGAYVHFGDGGWLMFDLAADPTWRTTTTDPAIVAKYAQEMLTWRQVHLDRTLTDMLLAPGRPGRWPSS